MKSKLLQTFEFFIEHSDGTEEILGVAEFRQPDRSNLWKETQSRLVDDISRVGYRVIHEDPKTILRRKKLKRLV